MRSMPSDAPPCRSWRSRVEVWWRRARSAHRLLRRLIVSPSTARTRSRDSVRAQNRSDRLAKLAAASAGVGADVVYRGDRRPRIRSVGSNAACMSKNRPGPACPRRAVLEAVLDHAHRHPSFFVDSRRARVLDAALHAVAAADRRRHSALAPRCRAGAARAPSVGYFGQSGSRPDVESSACGIPARDTEGLRSSRRAAAQLARRRRGGSARANASSTVPSEFAAIEERWSRAA